MIPFARADWILFPRLAGLLVLPLLAGRPGTFAEGLDSITPKECEAHVKVLASEEFAGRDTPSEGLERAGAYIAERLKEFGLEPGGDAEAYFQTFDVQVRVPAKDCSLAVTGGKAEGTFEVKKDWLPVPGSADGEARGEPIFLGYAIEATKYRYNDFSKAEVRGKVVLALTHEPREKKAGSVFDGLEPTKHSSIFEKARTVAEKGGVALLLVHDPVNHVGTTPLAYKSASGRRATPTQAAAPSIPVATVSLEAAERIIGLPIRPLQEKIDGSMTPQVVKCPGSEVTLVSKTENGPAPTRNVVAVRKGSDPEAAKQAVVIGAHYDHVGVNDIGQVYFGADDNASGSTALLEVAEAFSRTPTRRSVVFCWFAGEEAGLLGSEAYVKAPPRFTLDDTVAMVNTDMVGRGDLDAFSVAGTWDNPDLQSVVSRAQKLRPLKVKVDLDYGRQFFERSDQWNFQKHGVPALFVSEKDIEHKDYHQPTDSPDKIEEEKVSRAARLIFSIAYLLADEEKAPRRPAPTAK
ncbi:MAG: M28 family peptidase [Planctomycetes bacterium]|nr:M28 family peptidase [Planctomycetota bacterium]